jgi:hypothetical protein
MPISYHRDVSAASQTEAARTAFGTCGAQTAGLSRATPRRECRLPPPRRGEGGVSCHREISPNPKADRRDLSKGGDQFRRLTMSGVSGRLPLRVISGGAGPSPTRHVKLNKRTLTPRNARLSFVQKSRLSANFLPLPDQGLTFAARYDRKSLRGSWYVVAGLWVRPTPLVYRREPQLARRGLVRDGRTCWPSAPRTSARAATALTSARAPATAKAALKLPVAATT